MPTVAKKIIAYRGPEGSGKSYHVWMDTRAESPHKDEQDQSTYFIRHLYPNHVFNHIGLYAFAQKLKMDTAKETGLSYILFECPRLKDTIYGPTGKTPRQMIIEHATTVREIDPDIYTRAVVDMIRNDDIHTAYISDLRYDYELEALTEAFGAENIQVIDLG